MHSQIPGVCPGGGDVELIGAQLNQRNVFQLRFPSFCEKQVNPFFSELVYTLTDHRNDTNALFRDNVRMMHEKFQFSDWPLGPSLAL